MPRVLSADLEFTELPGLFALGPACFPRMGAANPALTVLALARRLAAHLAASGTCQAPISPRVMAAP